MNRVAALLCAAVLSGCAGSSLPPLDPPTPLTLFEPKLDVQRAWSRRVGDGVDDYYLKLPPLAGLDRVYAADRRGRVEALDAASGDRIWQTHLGGDVTAGPADGGEFILVASVADVVALAKDDGEVLWRTKAESEVLAQPLRVDDVIVVRSVGGTVAGHSAVDGRELWRYSSEVPLLTLRGSGPPVRVGDAVVVGLDNGDAIALDPASGGVLWRATVTEPRGRTDLERMADVDAVPAVGAGRVFLSAYQGRLAAIEADSGRVVWTRDVSSNSGIVFADDNLYVTDSRGDIWALSARSGGTLWKQDVLHGRILSAPALQGDYLVMGDLDGYVHWIRREDGRLAARIRVSSPEEELPFTDEMADASIREDRALLAAPAVGDARVFALDKRGVINAFAVKPLSR